MGIDDYEQVLLTSRADLRGWLTVNADIAPGVWAVTYKRATGEPAPSYEELVLESLCFGWIDSTLRTRDERTSMQLLTPRKPQSTWAATNKARVELLLAQGLMTERGLRAIEVAKANGSWSALDAVERLEIPDDLADALAARPSAREHFDAFPPSARKQALWFIASAKRPATRATRVAKVAEAAAHNLRAV